MFIWTLIVTEILGGTYIYIYNIYRLYGCAPLIRVWRFGSDSGNKGIKFTLYHLKRGTFYFSFTLEQGRTSLIRDYSQSSSV